MNLYINLLSVKDLQVSGLGKYEKKLKMLKNRLQYLEKVLSYNMLALVNSEC
jgi:hypothetical protein